MFTNMKHTEPAQLSNHICLLRSDHMPLTLIKLCLSSLHASIVFYLNCCVNALPSKLDLEKYSFKHFYKCLTFTVLGSTYRKYTFSK